MPLQHAPTSQYSSVLKKPGLSCSKALYLDMEEGPKHIYIVSSVTASSCNAVHKTPAMAILLVHDRSQYTLSYSMFMLRNFQPCMQALCSTVNLCCVCPIVLNSQCLIEPIVQELSGILPAFAVS